MVLANSLPPRDENDVPTIHGCVDFGLRIKLLKLQLSRISLIPENYPSGHRRLLERFFISQREATQGSHGGQEKILRAPWTCGRFLIRISGFDPFHAKDTAGQPALFCMAFVSCSFFVFFLWA